MEGIPLTDFEVFAVQQSFEVRWTGLEGSSADKRTFRGELSTRDAAEASRVEQMLTATLEGKAVDVVWKHSDDGQRHPFEVKDILRQEQPQILKLAVDGKPLGLSQSYGRQISIPGLGVFAALSARARGRTGPIEVRFSDPLAANQNPAGLFRTRSSRSLRFEVRGSVVRMYSSKAWEDTEVVTVLRAVRSASGRRLKRNQTFRITQAAQKPSVKFLGKGTILPLKEGAALPIETASLRAVRVRAIRVPPSNLGQFFQVNSIDGTSEMQRVGRVVWQKRVELGDDLGGGQVRHGLDLSKLVESQGEGLYNLQLSFRPEDTNYHCPPRAFAQLPPHSDEEEDLSNYAQAESSSWDFAWGATISGIDPSEQYYQRNNPCHIAYYVPQHSHDIRVSRNVLVTDIGVVAKLDPRNRLSIFATNLLTTTPLPGAKVEVFDFAQQLIAEGQTGADGRVALEPEFRPYMVMVRHDDQLGAIRLHDSESLTVSHFDVGGAEVNKGLKGFLFGERGVWRPGDDIYLHFILKDDDGRLPDNHPILFPLKGPRGAVVDSQRITESVGRFYAIRTRTGREAPTGNYEATVSVGGATFNQTLSIEAVVPNRLKIDLDFGTDLLKGPKTKLDSTLRSRWLHGAIARSLKTEIDVAFAATRTRFPKYGDYIFDDPTRRLRSRNQRIFNGKLDENGEVKVDSEINFDGLAPGMTSATFTTRVFEESGQSSSDRHTLRFSPFPRYVGAKMPKGDRARGMLLTDVDHPVDIVVVDADGQPVDTEVEAKIYKINWRWWWEKGAEDLSQYAGQVSHRVVAEGDVKVVKGKGQWKFQIKAPDWGRYLLVVADKNGTHRTGSVFYADWPGWAGRQQKDNPGGPAVLTVVADKPKVKVGEKFSITFPSAPN
ncbi:MAG: MG2 domain-containing protein, partial [Myxococcota bacterium]